MNPDANQLNSVDYGTVGMGIVMGVVNTYYTIDSTSIISTLGIHAHTTLKPTYTIYILKKYLEVVLNLVLHITKFSITIFRPVKSIDLSFRNDNLA